jgi:predicted dehydrogenase
MFHLESLEAGLGGKVAPVAVYSPQPEHRQKFAAACNERALSGARMEACDSLDRLLDRVDVVHVCAPASQHERVAVRALERNVNVILEKPFTGYFGPSDDADFAGNSFPKDVMRREARASARRIVEAERASTAQLFYAENWIFTPVVQKEVEILRKTRGQILWMIAEEAHSGSHSPTYGVWKSAGGGSIMGKGTHPITTVLYMKRIEGIARGTGPVRPRTVTSRVHELTRLPSYDDRGFLRTEYTDVEDFGMVHITFTDGTIADVFCSEIVMGGVHNWLEVFANNHRTRCNINPIDAIQSYNPEESQFQDIYVVEKIGTRQGWMQPAPDENWMNGYIQELSSFYSEMETGSASISYAELGYDTVDVIYGAYLSAEQSGKEVVLEDSERQT